MADTLTYPDVEDLLPHRGRMLLVGDIVRIEGDVAISKSRVNADWPLIDGGAASSLVIIELVAQTSGLSNGLELIKTQGEGADVKGWLVGVKKSRFYVDTLPLGAEIITETRNAFKFEGFREIEGHARIGSDLVGEVTLQVVQAQD